MRQDAVRLRAGSSVFAGAVFSAVVLLSAARAQAQDACPSLAEQKRILKVDGPEWRFACRVPGGGEMDLAAFIPSGPARNSPHLVVAVQVGEFRQMSELDLGGAEAEPIRALSADDWKLSIGPAFIPGADWLRVEATARVSGPGESWQSIVSFFRFASGIVQHLWTGLGDRREPGPDGCRNDTVVRFSLSEDAALVRSRTTVHRSGVKACAPESARTPAATDSFEVADDGLKTDNVPVSDKLRERIRANRLLYIRALKSRTALRRFVADSMALIDPIARETSEAQPTDPEQESWGIATDGAFAYILAGGGRRGLNWHSLRAAAGPEGRAVVDAMEALDRQDLGAWIEQRTDFGGCHRPESAEKTLTDLAAAWSAAPAYIRAAFKAYLLERLTDMAEDDCFCAGRDDRDKIAHALEHNAAILQKVPDVGAQIARKLRALSADRTARFECLGPG